MFSEASQRSETQNGHGFGTAPVFLASISTILGAILFFAVRLCCRTCWALGNTHGGPAWTFGDGADSFSRV